MSQIKDVFITANGLVVVFDENGQQLPKLQGVIFEVMNKIGKHANEFTQFHVAQELDVSWWFKERKVG